MQPQDCPFLYGAEYYRAPTPHHSNWAEDLKRMAESGFNAVKFFVQWRWVHRKPEAFHFEDIDRLMELAAENRLSVHVNLIFDVAPSWVFQRHPDCLMVTAIGQRLEPRAVACRQIGGYPGPCFNHAEARHAREAFLRKTVSRYGNHPAMGMWDVWNEPESCLFLRQPKDETLVCYCHNCRHQFIEWLHERYGKIDSLNDVWGRCYSDWDDIELPRDRGTYADMVDWRLFHLDVLAAEARWRIASVKSIDARHPVYLHPVPNTLGCFNPVTGVDDFQIAEGCDCFGGTINGYPDAVVQTVSAARGRVTYNVESHLRAGSTTLYPAHLSCRDIANALLPQIGLGVRGFLYWQYRCETLGNESPAWGLLDIDGKPGETHAAATEFWKRLRLYAPRLMQARPAPPEAAIYKSVANDILHWCMAGEFTDLLKGVEGYTEWLYRENVPFVYVDDRGLVDELPNGIRLLVLPCVYAMTSRVAETLADWVEAGGVLVCEAHTGGYDIDHGRHSTVMPGLGLADRFGMRETNATAVAHLGVSQQDGTHIDWPADVRKAVEAHGLAGGHVLPLAMADGNLVFGWSRYAEIAGESLHPLAGLSGRPPCVAWKNIGKGAVFYIGTQWARLWTPANSGGVVALLAHALDRAGIVSHAARYPTMLRGVHIDSLPTQDGTAFVLVNHTDDPISIPSFGDEPMYAVFSKVSYDPRDRKLAFDLSSGQAELVVPGSWTNS